MVHGGERRTGEEDPRRFGVAEVPVLLQVGVDGLLDRPHLGLARYVPQRGEQVALHLDGPHDAVAVHEQRGAAQPGGVVDLGLGRLVAGQDLGDLRLGPGLDGEREGVAGHSVAHAGLDLPGRPDRLRGERLGGTGLAEDAVAHRPGVPDAAVHRPDGLDVLLAVHPGEEGRGTLPLAGDEPLRGVLDRLAELVTDVAGYRGDLVAHEFVRVEELLLSAFVQVEQQDHPKLRAVEGRLRDTSRDSHCGTPLLFVTEVRNDRGVRNAGAAMN